MRGVSLEELSSATRISTRFLTAIENGQWEELPGGAFNRGYIRSASRYLGLDEDGMVAEYALETSNGIQPVVFPAATKRQIQTVAKRNRGSAAGKSRVWMRLAALAAIAIVVIAVAWFAGSKIVHRLRARSAAAGTATNKAANQKAGDPASSVARAGSATARAAQSVVAPAALALAVQATRRARVTVKADGKLVFQGEMKAGERKNFNAQQAFDISTNHARAVRLELNGQPVASMGAARGPGSVTLTAKDSKH